MAVIKGSKLSGKLGPVVAATWKDIEYLRSLPRKRKANDWSEKQFAHRKCFTAVNAFAKISRDVLIKPFWNRAAKGNLSGYNLFIKANKPAFEPAGELIDPRMLKMTIGNLPLPFNIEATYRCSDSALVDISWENASSLDSVRGTDKLMIILFRNLHMSAPIDTGFKRSQCNAHLELTSGYGNIECIYVFFQNKKGYEFSDSFAVAV